MSKHITYVRPDLTMLPAILQERVIRKFLPFELIPAGWQCQEKSFIENIRSLYKATNMRVQYYGSPENLEKFLLKFISFPGSQQLFQFDDSVFYKTNLSVYYSLGGKIFIYKKDMYELLFEYIPRISTLPPLRKLAHSLMNYYLRTMKRRLTTSHEMIGIDDGFRGRLCCKQRYIEEMMETGRWKLKPGCFAFEKNGDILDDINEMFMHSEIKAEMGSEMRKTVTMVTKEVSVNENISEYKKVLTWLYFTIDDFLGFIKNNKSMMLLRSETVDSFPTSTIPIRLFENDQEKVVMSHELLLATKLEKLDVSGFEDKILSMPKLSAMSFREVFEMIPSNIFKMLEFIRIPMSEHHTEHVWAKFGKN
ncbi:hypothetical protein CAEBREN_00253 [Caenorhabditis brenneri]|uniref:DUF7809 domain-containing protein n=1 Tax=Caenorhabditis brenneri TaxID=135651 RepID=G0P0D1_CAEBE|nr:hypothetical protein CAEBREN_00253 [Caenorhabditis brenneri]